MESEQILCTRLFVQTWTFQFPTNAQISAVYVLIWMLLAVVLPTFLRFSYYNEILNVLGLTEIGQAELEEACWKIVISIERN